MDGYVLKNDNTGKAKRFMDGIFKALVVGVLTVVLAVLKQEDDS